jgi:formiminotetrahydrofolate cyclodeaminase
VDPAASAPAEPRDEILGLSVGELLAQVSARTPAPGAGAVAAVVVGLAAGLASMAGRFSAGHWDGATSAAERAEALRRQAEPLAARDGRAYAAVLAAYRLTEQPGSDTRSAAVASALLGAAEVPMEIAAIGAGVARIAADLVEQGNPNLRGDAAAGALFAEAGTRVAASLVAINLASTADDRRVTQAAAYAAAASEAAERALSALRS